MVFSYGCGDNRNQQRLKIQANCWPFRSPCRWGDTAPGASPNGANFRLHTRSSTGCRHRDSARAALPRRPPWTTICCKTQNTNKVAIMPSSESLTPDAQLGEVYVDIFLAKQEVTITISPWKAICCLSQRSFHMMFRTAPKSGRV